MITSTLMVLAILILTQICKKYIGPKWGDTGIHVFVFLVALLFVSVRAYATYNPTFGHLLIIAGEYLAASIGVYEVILKKITS